MATCARAALLAVALLAVSVSLSEGAFMGRRPRSLLAQPEGIFLNQADVDAVQRKADRDAQAKLSQAISKYATHPKKSGWSKYQMKSTAFKKNWEAMRNAPAGGNKRKSDALGYQGFVSKSQAAQNRWHMLNQRALGKGHISKLPETVFQPYKGKEYKKSEGKGAKIYKTDKEGNPIKP